MARALGYGGVLTGLHHFADAELRALLDMPEDALIMGDHHFQRRPQGTTARCAAGPCPSWSSASAGAGPGLGHRSRGHPVPRRPGHHGPAMQVAGVATRADPGRLTMPTRFDYHVFDADNHYYEALDAFTRHLDPALGPRVIECEPKVTGRRYHSVGGRINHAVTNPTFNPISPAGALFDYFRGNPNGVPMRELMGKPEPIRPEYRDRDARLAVMDTQSIGQVWLFPTLGMLYEEALRDDPEAVVLLFRAFNRWLAEDWGYWRTETEIFAAPYITLVDVDEAVRGARVGPRPGCPAASCSEPPRRGRPRAHARRRRTSSTRSGPGSTRPASRWWSTPGRRPSRRTGDAVDGFAATFKSGSVPAPEHRQGVRY